MEPLGNPGISSMVAIAHHVHAALLLIEPPPAFDATSSGNEAVLGEHFPDCLTRAIMSTHITYALHAKQLRT